MLVPNDSVVFNYKYTLSKTKHLNLYTNKENNTYKLCSRITDTNLYYVYIHIQLIHVKYIYIKYYIPAQLYTLYRCECIQVNYIYNWSTTLLFI